MIELWLRAVVLHTADNWHCPQYSTIVWVLFAMLKIRLQMKEACRRCQKLGFVNIFPTLAKKESHAKRHLAVDYDIPSTNPPPNPELVVQILDSCFACVEDEERPATSKKVEPNEDQKPTLDKCLLCGFQCARTPNLEQHWSHVALGHLETPDIFGCSKCNSVWDTPKPFGEHLMLQHPREQAELLDRRDRGLCDIFQICFDLSDERLAAAGLGHLFQSSMEQSTAPTPPAESKQARGKITDRCLLCSYEFVTERMARAKYRWKHIASCHLVCHPGKDGQLRDTRTSTDWNVYHMCFGQLERRQPCPVPSASPKQKRGRKTKLKRYCSLCRYQVPECRHKVQEYMLRWVHVSQKHADGRPLFHCPLCQKSGNYVSGVTYYCQKNHPTQKAVVDDRKELRELHQRCFLYF